MPRRGGCDHRRDDPECHRRGGALVDYRDSGKSVYSQGDDSAVYGHGQLQRWLEAEPDELGDLAFLELLGRYNQQYRFGDGSRGGNFNYPGNFGHSDWIHSADGKSSQTAMTGSCDRRRSSALSVCSLATMRFFAVSARRWTAHCSSASRSSA
jgi:hypothetical protein